jgi:hypothetical protein
MKPTVPSANTATLQEQFQTFCFVAQHNENIVQDTTLSVVIQGNLSGDGYLGDNDELEEGEISPDCVEMTEDVSHSNRTSTSTIPCTQIEQGEILNPRLTCMFEHKQYDASEAFLEPLSPPVERDADYLQNLADFNRCFSGMKSLISSSDDSSSEEGSSTEGVPGLVSESSEDTDTGDELFVPGYNFNQRSPVTKSGDIPIGTNVSPYFVTFGETPSGMWIKQEPQESKRVALKEQQRYVLEGL